MKQIQRLGKNKSYDTVKEVQLTKQEIKMTHRESINQSSMYLEMGD